jgi:hypothetical protein
MKCPQNTVDSLIDSIYPRLDQQHHGNAYFLERTILAPRNDDVAVINSMVLSRFMGEKKVFQAADEMVEDPNNEIAKTVPIEFLNSITTSGLSPARLELKLGCPLMILRNLASEQGVRGK